MTFFRAGQEGVSTSWIVSSLGLRKVQGNQLYLFQTMSDLPVMRLACMLLIRFQNLPSINLRHATFTVQNILTYLTGYINIIGYLIYRQLPVSHPHVTNTINRFPRWWYVQDVQILGRIEDSPYLSQIQMPTFALLRNCFFMSCKNVLDVRKKYLRMWETLPLESKFPFI